MINYKNIYDTHQLNLYDISDSSRFMKYDENKKIPIRSNSLNKKELDDQSSQRKISKNVYLKKTIGSCTKIKKHNQLVSPKPKINCLDYDEDKFWIDCVNPFDGKNMKY